MMNIEIEDPLSVPLGGATHKAGRDERRYCLECQLSNSLHQAYELAHRDFVWSLRRAMLLLSGQRGKVVAREIWGLTDSSRMKMYWDAKIAKGKVPTFEDLFDNWPIGRKIKVRPLLWDDDVSAALDVGPVVSGAHPDDWYLSAIKIVIQATDILVAFVKEFKGLKLYHANKNFLYLESPPQEAEVITSVMQL